MLKKLVLLILMLLLALPAAAESSMSLVITGEMQFYSGPGTQYLQSAFHNTPPQPGEAAQVLGRVPGADGQDWLFVRFTGHWFSKEQPVQYYLPVSAAPEFADAPLLTFTREPNALAAESVRIYADPEGTNYDGYLNPNDAGVTVLDTQGSMAYIEAVNPYGFLHRGYVSIKDLAAFPGASSLPAAPQGTAVLAQARDIPLTHMPATSYAEALRLADGRLILQYGTIPENAPWGEALAIISPDGQLIRNFVYRTHDGMEESTIEFLLTSPEGFKVCRYVGDALTPVHETHYTPDGVPSRTDVRRHSDGDPRPRMATAGFTVSLGRTSYAEETGGTTIPLRITAAGGSVMQMNVDMCTTLLDAVECGDLLLVSISDESGPRFLVFDENAALVSDTRLPANLLVSTLHTAPMADGRIALLLGDGVELWQCWYLDTAAGLLTPGQSLNIPYNRRVALLAADEEQLLIAISGVDTQLLLTDEQTQQLAATTPGMVIHVESDGSTATLLLMQDSQLRVETWQLHLP